MAGLLSRSAGLDDDKVILSLKTAGEIPLIDSIKTSFDLIEYFLSDENYESEYSITKENMESFIRDYELDIDAMSKDGELSSWMIAILQGRRDDADLLRELGADPNFQNRYGDSIIHILALERKFDALYSLIQEGYIDITLKNRNRKGVCYILYNIIDKIESSKEIKQDNHSEPFGFEVRKLQDKLREVDQGIGGGDEAPGLCLEDLEVPSSTQAEPQEDSLEEAIGVQKTVYDVISKFRDLENASNYYYGEYPVLNFKIRSLDLEEAHRLIYKGAYLDAKDYCTSMSALDVVEKLLSGEIKPLKTEDKDKVVEFGLDDKSKKKLEYIKELLESKGAVRTPSEKDAFLVAAGVAERVEKLTGSHLAHSFSLVPRQYPDGQGDRAPISLLDINSVRTSPSIADFGRDYPGSEGGSSEAGDETTPSVLLKEGVSDKLRGYPGSEKTFKSESTAYI